jgi:hypothetical protein
MLNIFVTCITIAATVLVGYTVTAKMRRQTQEGVTGQSEKKPPKLGYSDLFIPPTKGNGF